VVGFPAPADAEGRKVKVKPSVVSVVAELTEVGTVTVSNLVLFVGKEAFAVRATVVLLRANASRIHDCRSNEESIMNQPSAGTATTTVQKCATKVNTTHHSRKENK
jgi:hypothetical protein